MSIRLYIGSMHIYRRLHSVFFFFNYSSVKLAFSFSYYCQHIQSLRPSVFLVKVLDIKEAEREDDSLLCPSRDASPKGKLLLYFSNAKQRNLWMWKLLKPQWNIESFITTLEAPAHSLVTCKYSICFLFQIETLCLFLIIV